MKRLMFTLALFITAIGANAQTFTVHNTSPCDVRVKGLAQTTGACNTGIITTAVVSIPAGAAPYVYSMPPGGIAWMAGSGIDDGLPCTPISSSCGFYAGEATCGYPGTDCIEIVTACNNANCPQGTMLSITWGNGINPGDRFVDIN